MRDAARRILVLTAAVWRIDAPLQKCAGAFLLEMRMKSLFILVFIFDWLIFLCNETEILNKKNPKIGKKKKK